MRAYLSVTRQFFEQIRADAMLAVLLFVPVLMGLAFRFGVPALEVFICAKTGIAAVLSPYYPLFDLMLAAMTPIMFTAAGALVILDEADSGISRAIITTPVGRNGYLIFRIVVPSLLAIVYCVAAVAVFRLSALGFGTIILLALCSGALGVVIAFMIPALAKNKVEGMAYSKFSGLFMLGVPVAVLVESPARYICGILPTFWMTELVMAEKDSSAASLWEATASLIMSALWAMLFAKRFSKRVV